jgi:hypothetical protein
MSKGRALRRLGTSIPVTLVLLLSGVPCDQGGITTPPKHPDTIRWC